MAWDEAFVVAGGGAPLATGAGVGLDVGEGGAAEEEEFDVGVGSLELSRGVVLVEVVLWSLLLLTMMG